MSEKEILSHTKRIERRSKIITKIIDRLYLIRFILFFTGFGWLILLPWNGLSRRAWIDENALQPGHVNVDWNWGDVQIADTKLALLEDLWNRNASSVERANFIKSQFQEYGLASNTQFYTFGTPSENITGNNAYGVYRAQRTSGMEAIVIAASWVSRQQEGANLQPNLRGIATVLSLASSLKRRPVWAKDLIFLVSDSYLDGAHAWLSAYHGDIQQNLHAEPLLHPEPQGVIWTALVLDYPGHSFSHLGLFFEGTNARLPNQDLSNSAWVISHSMGVPWVLYDHKDEDAFRVPSALSEIFGHDMNEYSRRARNIVRHLSYQAVGEPSGVHGLFHKYRIDAITLYALPARGPHGFHSLGRVVESLLRTSNNLLERLHASFFFYLFTAPGEFAEFARYLPPVIILGLAVSFGGLRMFVQTGWIPKRVPSTEKQPQRSLVWAMRDRPVLEVACIMASTYLVGVGTFSIVTSRWTWAELKNSKLHEVIFVSSAPSIALLGGIFVYSRAATSHRLPPTTPALLKAFNLCSLGVVISVIAVANFSLSASVAVLAALPLCLVPVSLHQNHEGYKHGLTAVFVVRRAFALVWLLTISPPGLLIVAQMLEQNVAGSNGMRVLMWLRRMLWESVILKTWFLPLVSTIYLPHILQGLIVCILPL